MKKSGVHRIAARMAVAATALLVVLLLAQAAGAEEDSWNVTLFSYDFESDTAGGPPSVNASDPAAWSASASSPQSTLTVVAEDGGKVLQYERVSASTGIGGPRVDKRLSLEPDSRVRVDFRIRTMGHRFEFDLRSGSADDPASTRLLALNGSTLVANPPAGSSFDANGYVDAAVEIDTEAGTYSSYLNAVPIQTDALLNAALSFADPVVFRFSAVLNPDERLYVDEVTIRMDKDMIIDGLRPEHPRLMATSDDFAALRARVQSDPVSEGWYDELMVKAEGLLGQPVSQYEFPDGRTLLQISRKVLDRTYILATVYQIGGDERFADRLWDELEAVAAFPDWNPQSFLSTAELTHAFAIGYDWLYAYWSPAQRQTLSGAIVELGLQPGLNGYNNGEWWTATTNNWNIVTNSGLGMGALAVADEAPVLADEIITRGLGFLPLAIGEYAPDGAYPESVGYWAYATRYLVPYMAALQTALGDDFGLSASAGLPETGLYPLYMAGPSGNSFHYYDANGELQQPPELFWLAKAYDNPVYAWWGSQGGGATPRHLLWYNPADLQSPAAAGLPPDKYFRGSELVSSRSAWDSPDAVFTGFKAGSNRTNHGDLDLGTFVLDALGVRWAYELGPENYGVPGYWSGGADGQRWTYYRKRAEGQNTLVVNPGSGPDQDPLAAGEIVRFESGPAETFSVAELTEAYANRGVTSWQRGVKLFDHRRQVLVQDELQASEPVDVWWFMHTKADIQIASDGRSAILEDGGERMQARILSPSAGASFLAMDAAPLWSSPDPAEQTDNLGMRKLAVSIEAAESLRLAILFTPLREDQETGGTPPAVEPLADWQIAYSAVPELAALKIDGTAVEGFAPDVFTYDVRMEAAGGTAPVVTAEVYEPSDQVTVQQAGAVPGTSVITLSRPGQPDTRYEVHFRSPPGQSGTGPVMASIVGTFPPSHTIDGNLSTFFSAEGQGQWVQYDLGESHAVNGVSLAWYQGDVRAFTFKVLASEDAQSWTEVYSGVSSGNTLALEDYLFSAATARYVRIVGYGNTVNQWMSITEARILHEEGIWPGAEYVQPYLERVDLSAGAEELAVGGSVQLQVYGKLSDGSIGNLDSGTVVHFISSDENVAVVNVTGAVYGVAPGTVRLSAYVTTADRTLLYDTVALTVIDPFLQIVRPAADAYVRGGDYGDDNYGTASSLVLKNDSNLSFRREAYLSFDIGSLAGEIESATLYMSGAVSTGGAALPAEHAIHIHALDPEEAWAENTVTWNTRPAVLGEVVSVQANEVKHWLAGDITSLAIDQLSSGERIALALRHEAPPGDRFALSVSSREQTAFAPYIELRLKP